MRGSVLGHDAAAQMTVVRGDDGQRYRFLVSQWREDRPPRKGDRVDFEPDGTQALDVYRIAEQAPHTGRSAMVEEPPARLVARWPAVRYLLARPVLPLALMVVLLSLTTAYTIDGVRLSIVAAPELAWRMSAAINALLETSGADPAPRLAGALARIATASLLLLYLVPVLAGLAAWREFAGRPAAGVARYAGLAAMVLPLALPLLVVALVRFGVVPALPELPVRLGRDGVSSPLAAFQIWTLYAGGTFLLMVAGLALWAAATGRLAGRIRALTELGERDRPPVPEPNDTAAGHFVPPRAQRPDRPVMRRAPPPDRGRNETVAPPDPPRPPPQDGPPAWTATVAAPVHSVPTAAADAMAALTERLRLALSGNGEAGGAPPTPGNGRAEPPRDGDAATGRGAEVMSLEPGVQAREPEPGAVAGWPEGGARRDGSAQNR
jgi:hypothetical protein